jgi:endonuclease YncB( thermonuclease family)
MPKLFSHRRPRFSLSTTLLILFTAISIGQYVATREVTWLTDTLRWIDHNSRAYITAPEASLKQARRQFTRFADDAKSLVSDSLSSLRLGDLTDPDADTAYELSGRVVKVSDGDTITILDDSNTQHKIRLHGIDTPEYKQDYGQAARNAMSRLLAGKTVGIDVKDRDRYGRTVGVVYVDGLNANLEMVRLGYAWWYRQYAQFDSDLERAETNARQRGLGLWAAPNPVPPWDWRRGTRIAQSGR